MKEKEIELLGLEGMYCISLSKKSCSKGSWFKSYLDNLMLCAVCLDKELHFIGKMDNGLDCPIHGESLTLIRLARQKMGISVAL